MYADEPTVALDTRYRSLFEDLKLSDPNVMLVGFRYLAMVPIGPVPIGRWQMILILEGEGIQPITEAYCFTSSSVATTPGGDTTSGFQRCQIQQGQAPLPATKPTLGITEQ
jgi:hypothetical protein